MAPQRTKPQALVAGVLSTRKYFYAVIAVVVIALAVAGIRFSIVSFDTMESQSTDISFTTTDYLRASGFDPSRSHHLQLGAPIVGSLGSIHGSGYGTVFLFGGAGSFEVDGTTRPSSSVRMGISLGERSYIIEIPYEDVQFIQSADKPQSAVFVMDDDPLDSDSQYYFSNYAKRNVSYSCRTFLNPGCYKVQERQPTVRDTEFWGRVQSTGVGKLIQHKTTTVRLTLKPAQYQKYLNG